MKYKLICLLISASLLVACEKDPIDTKGNAISFNNSPARAAVVPNEQNGLVDNARVWGYYVNGSNTTWVWGNATAGEKANLEITTDGNNNLTGGLIINGNTKYWTVGIYDFFSIYSEKFISTTTEPTFSNGTLSFTYDISDQKELRYACHLNTTGSATRLDKVDFNYQHLLSRVKFQGFSKVSGKPIVVKSVFISNIPTTATVSLPFGVDNEGEDMEENMKSIVPSYAYSDNVNLQLMENSSETGMYLYKGDEANISEENQAKIPENNIVLDKMVFPSDEALKGVTFTIAYDVDGVEQEPQTATFTDGYKFEAGKSYLLKFYIQPSEPIEFSTDVTIYDWDEEIETSISMDDVEKLDPENTEGN